MTPFGSFICFLSVYVFVVINDFLSLRNIIQNVECLHKKRKYFSLKINELHSHDFIHHHPDRYIYYFKKVSKYIKSNVKVTPIYFVYH